MKHSGPPKFLFDEFWREGELALMFGAAGTGKSSLAMQIADSLARRRPICGFQMTAKRQRVLYVDMRLSDRHFELRYTSDTPKNGRYSRFRFADELYRQRPSAGEDLCTWLRKAVIDDQFRVIVIDDLSAVRNTLDGTRETLQLIRQLRRLKDEFDLSILVLAGCREPGRSGRVSETDLQRSRVLCDAADSVFAIGVHPRNAAQRYLVQTRAAGTAIVWNEKYAPVASISKIDGNFLGLTFDERFKPTYAPDQIDQICNLKLHRDDGATYRDLAYVFDISTSTAHRLLKMFRPWMMNGREHLKIQRDLEIEQESEKETLEQDADDERVASSSLKTPDEMAGHAEAGPTPEPINDDPPPRHLPALDTPRDILRALGMRQTYDENDREIFIEKENGPNRHVWYRFDAANRFSAPDLLSRFQSNGTGAVSKRVDGPICLFNTS